MSSSPSTAVFIFSYSFFSVELIICVAVLAITFLNLAVILPTKLLHLNLKSILITQTVTTMIFVGDRSIMLVHKLIFSNNLFAPANMTLQAIMTFISIYKNVLGHVLFVERFFATVRTKAYQKISTLYLFIAWFSITVFTEFNFITSILFTVLGLVEFIIIALIGYYNRRKYCNQLQNAGLENYTIAQRYEVAENVKTSQQLLPTFFGIFLSNLSLYMNYVIMWYKLLKEDYQISICFAILICVNSIICGVIELTVITHHPLLKRRFLRLLKIMANFRRNRIDTVPPIAVELNGIGCKKNENETTEHFKMLQQAWNK
ncbi:hypothetical protein niasHS_008507 [Heterodera schachtii]|uniref:Gustatory receptor n=1 Tax=Heterodera schachtii TaxID=97005 RepID=A0ABD2JEY9_HETSC